MAANAVEGAWCDVVGGLTGNRYTPGLLRMTILPVAPALAHQGPAVSMEHTNHVTDLGWHRGRSALADVAASREKGARRRSAWQDASSTQGNRTGGCPTRTGVASAGGCLVRSTRLRRPNAERQVPPAGVPDAERRSGRLWAAGCGARFPSAEHPELAGAEGVRLSELFGSVRDPMRIVSVAVPPPLVVRTASPVARTVRLRWLGLRFRRLGLRFRRLGLRLRRLGLRYRWLGLVQRRLRLVCRRLDLVHWRLGLVDSGSDVATGGSDVATGARTPRLAARASPQPARTWPPVTGSLSRRPE